MDFLHNIIIGRDDPIWRSSLFLSKTGRPTDKAAKLRSPESEDALTWNVFRTLQSVGGGWLDRLFRVADLDLRVPEGPIGLAFWRRYPPPRCRLCWLVDNVDQDRIRGSRGGRRDPKRLDLVAKHASEWKEAIAKGHSVDAKATLEGHSEVDLVVSVDTLFVAIEAKLWSKLSEVTWDHKRDQIGRTVDVALNQGGAVVPVALLVTPAPTQRDPPAYEEVVARYVAGGEQLAHLLPHWEEGDRSRVDGRIRRVTWAQLYAIADDLAPASGRRREAVGALRAFMDRSGLLP